MMKKRISGYSFIELLVIISMVAALLIVTSPSFFGVLKRQFLIYDGKQVVQIIRNIQSKAFINHTYYKVSFDDTDMSYTIKHYITNSWEDYESDIIENATLSYVTQLSNSNSIMYGPNGNAYICNTTDTPNNCMVYPLTTTAEIKLSSKEKDFVIQFLPISGYVSSNISVE